MISSLIPLLVHPSRAGEVAPCELTNKNDQLQSVSELMSTIGADFARHARRSMPFLARYRSGLVPTLPGMVGGAELPRTGGAAPKYGLMLMAKKGSGWLAVWVNAEAINLIFEGALGGSALFDSAPVSPELTAPQRALVDRVTRSLLRDLAAAVEGQTGLKLADDPKPIQAAESDGIYVTCNVQNLAIPAAVIVAASSEILIQAVDARTPTPREEPNLEMLAALRGVEVDLIAELGRVTTTLRNALDLAVGDVIRLNTASGDPIILRIDGIPKFNAIPMTSRGQMAVEIRNRHGE